MNGSEHNYEITGYEYGSNIFDITESIGNAEQDVVLDKKEDIEGYEEYATISGIEYQAELDILPVALEEYKEEHNIPLFGSTTKKFLCEFTPNLKSLLMLRRLNINYQLDIHVVGEEPINIDLKDPEQLMQAISIR